MFLEDPASFWGDRDEGARLAFDEGLIDGDVAGFFEFTQVGAQVAVGDLQQVEQVGEFYFGGLYLLARARRAKHPGIVIVRAAPTGEIDPLTYIESRLMVGYPVISNLLLVQNAG